MAHRNARPPHSTGRAPRQAKVLKRITSLLPALSIEDMQALSFVLAQLYRAKQEARSKMLNATSAVQDKTQDAVHEPQS